jgi:hypothetical protein
VAAGLLDQVREKVHEVVVEVRLIRPGVEETERIAAFDVHGKRKVVANEGQIRIPGLRSGRTRTELQSSVSRPMNLTHR